MIVLTMMEQWNSIEVMGMLHMYDVSSNNSLVLNNSLSNIIPVSKDTINYMIHCNLYFNNPLPYSWLIKIR